MISSRFSIHRVLKSEDKEEKMMIIKIYGKTFYPSKKVCDSLFAQGGTADGYYKTDKTGVIRFYQLNGLGVIISGCILVKGIKRGIYLYLLFQGVRQYVIKTLRYKSECQFISTDAYRIYQSKAPAYKHFREILKNCKGGN